MKIFAYLLVFTAIFSSVSQAQFELSTNKYLILFADKDNSPYSIDKPEEFLTARAIERREKTNVAIDITDIPVNKNYIEEVEGLGFTLLNVSKWMNGISVYAEDTKKLKELKKLSFVREYKPVKKNIDKKIQTTKNTIKKVIENKLNRAGIYYDYGQSENQIHMLNGHVLHNKGFRGNGMQIAILDAGFFHVDQLPAFDSLRANNQILGTRDFVAGGEVSYQGSTHGMHVLSTIGGNIPGQLIGTAPEASFWLLRSEDGASETLVEEFNWLVAAEFADSVGADVINSSLGYSEFDDESQNHTYEQMDGNTTIVTFAADFAAKKGVLVVTSAGNEGFGNWRYITAPADADSVLTVGAVSDVGKYVYFSSIGPSFDGRVKPDVCAKGLNATVQGANGSVSTSSGTSFSGPIMAGMVTCLWQAYPNKTNMEIIEAVRQASSQYHVPDVYKGYGIPNFGLAGLLLSVEEMPEMPKDFINVYPNPFDRFLNTEFITEITENAPVEIKIELTDMAGKVMYLKITNSSAVNYNHLSFLDLEDLPKGMYILRITTPQKAYNEKVLKN